MKFKIHSDRTDGVGFKVACGNTVLRFSNSASMRPSTLPKKGGSSPSVVVAASPVRSSAFVRTEEMLDQTGRQI